MSVAAASDNRFNEFPFFLSAARPPPPSLCLSFILSLIYKLKKQTGWRASGLGIYIPADYMCTRWWTTSRRYDKEIADKIYSSRIMHNSRGNQTREIKFPNQNVICTYVVKNGRCYYIRMQSSYLNIFSRMRKKCIVCVPKYREIFHKSRISCCVIHNSLIPHRVNRYRTPIFRCRCIKF